MAILILHSGPKLSIVSAMIRPLFVILGAGMLLGSGLPAQGQALKADPALANHLQNVYLHWRQAMMQKNLANWRAVTARHRQVAIRNRILSERGDFAASLFNLPASPPDIAKLKLLDVKVKGPTANAFFFGPVDF
jgi:hypothetical protein